MQRDFFAHAAAEAVLAAHPRQDLSRVQLECVLARGALALHGHRQPRLRKHDGVVRRAEDHPCFEAVVRRGVRGLLVHESQLRGRLVLGEPLSR